MVIIDLLLNIIGIICILLSLIIINRTSNKEKNIYRDIIHKYSDIKYYYEHLNNMFNDFTQVVNTGLNKVESLQSSGMKEFLPKAKDEINSEYLIKNLSIKEPNKNDDNKNIMEKVIELRKQGMSEKEIAKSLNKGIREVEIIIKMLENI